MNTGKLPKINIVTVGHKDHGKSTFLGRLLYDSGSLKEGELEELKQNVEKLGKENLEYAFLIDKLKEEIEGGLTIDIMHVPFRSKKYDYTFIDCPGHKEFIKNMITGASKSNAAVLVISAKEDERIMDQTKEHIFLVKTLGINNIVVAISKMDTVNYDKEIFDEISRKIKEFLDSIGYDTKNIPFVPISALKDGNVFQKWNGLSWYDGSSLLETLDEKFKLPKPTVDKPLRISIQDIYDIDEKKLIIGKVESGILRVGDKIILQPSGTKAEVKSIQALNEKKEEAFPGEPVGLELKYVKGAGAKRGDIAGHLNNPPKKIKKFYAHVISLYPSEFKIGNWVLIHHGNKEVKCKITNIEKLKEKFAEEVKKIEFTPLEPIVVEKYIDNPQLGRFLIRDKGNIVAGGVVLDILKL